MYLNNICNMTFCDNILQYFFQLYANVEQLIGNTLLKHNPLIMIT